MATAWDKDEIVMSLIDPTTGANDTTLRTVEIYPTTDTYPTNKVACTQLATAHRYKPVSNLDSETHYWIRIARGATIYTHKLPGKNSEPGFGSDPG